MFHRTSERGQALIFIALAAIGLFAFAALAIDGTRSFSNKRHAQNAADTSVLAAALAKVKGEDYEAAALARATSNGYTNNASTTVEVALCDAVVCEGLPASATAAQKAEYIRVRIVSTIPTTFGRVLGRQTLTAAAEAIAHVTGGGSASSGGPFTGAGMVSTKNGNYDQCLMMNGGGDLYIHGSGIVINCTGSKAWWMDGNSTLHMDATGKVAGCYYENGSSNWEYSEDPIICNQASHTFTADDFKDVPTTDPVPTCSTNGTVASGSTDADVTGTPPSITVKKNTVVINPGKWGTINAETGSTLKMKPGVYCLSGGITVKAGSTLVNTTGTDAVQIVLGNNSFIVNGAAGGGSSVDFDNLELFFTNGSYQQNSSKVSFNADRLRIFITGTGNVDVNAGGTFTSGNAYMYLYRGDIIWNSDTVLNIKASKDADDKYRGLLVYKPWGNTVETKFNGGSNVYLQGTFLAPTAHVVYNGGSDWELHSQIIADSFTVNGNTDVDIYYVADENYSPPSAPAALIQLTK